MEDEKRVPKFQETITLEQISQKIERGGSSRELLQLFERCPIYEVRRDIIKGLITRHYLVHPGDADLIEQRIIDLKEEGDRNYSGNSLWRDLLSWYVFNTSSSWYVFNTSSRETTSSVSRAIEFAISITKREMFGYSRGLFYRSDILKILAGRLKDDHHLYWSEKTPSLKLFLLSFLINLYQFKYPIINCEMIDIKRIIDIAVKVEDRSFFLPHLEKVLQKIYQSQEEEVKLKIKYDFEKEVNILQNQVQLKEAIRFLREENKEEKEAEESEVL